MSVSRTLPDFADECDRVAKQLRRVPKDLRRELSGRVKTEVAAPLTTRIRAAATGPYREVLAQGTKARAAADPTIVVGGLSPKLSGGAGPRQVAFGVEFGGGSRIGAVGGHTRRGARVRGHRRHTTRQFRGRQRPFVFPTIERNMDATLDAYATIVLDVLEDAVE